MGSKMKVVCEHCSAEHELDQTEMTGRGVRITCPACSHVFVVYQDDVQVDVQVEGQVDDSVSDSGFEIDFDIELDENGELSMDLDEMLSSIVSEVDSGSENENDAGPSSTETATVKQDVQNDTNEPASENFFSELAVEPSTESSTESSTSISSVDEVGADVEQVGRGVIKGATNLGVQADEDSGSVSDNTVDTPITPDQVEALDVHALNFASVGIKSWKVKKSIGLMFEYSDFKTFQKSLQDGRISSDDQLSADGKKWVSMADISDYEQYFCKTYLEFESRGVVEEVKVVKEKVIQHVGGTNELASALAAAQAEVEQANTPSPQSRRQTRPNRTKKRVKSAPTKPEKSSNNGLLVNVLIGVAILGGGWFFFSGSDKPADIPQQQANAKAPQKAQPVKEEADEASLRALREELQASAAKIEAEQEPEPEPSMEEEPQLIAKVPEEVLAQQRAMAAGQNAPAVKKPKTDPATEGQKALRSQQWQKAVEQFTLAYKKTQNPEYLSSVGLAQFKAGQFGVAKKSLQSAIKKGSVSANKWLGYLLREEGDIAGSNQYLNQYLKTNPVDAAEVERRMRE